VYEVADCGLLSSDLAAGFRRVKGAKKLVIALKLVREQDRYAKTGDLRGDGTNRTFSADICPLKEQAAPSLWVGVSSPRTFAMKRDGLN
jgi:hypothetical protein